MYKNPESLVEVVVDDEMIPVEKLDFENIEIFQKNGNGKFVIKYKNKHFKLKILREDREKGVLTIRIGGHTYQASTRTELYRLINELGFQEAAVGLEKEVIAPMPGLVLNVEVKEGQEVEEDQVLLTLEAMKMENIIKSPSGGKIAVIKVNKGDKVDKGSVLIELE